MYVVVSLTVEMDASVSLREMEHRIQEAGQQAMRQAFQHSVRQWEDEQGCCPHCGDRHRRLEGTVRRVVSLPFGRVQVQRRRFRCLGCGRRWCPANQLFASLGAATMSAALQEAAQLAGCSWPYRVAARLLHRLSGAQISAEEIRLLTNRQGKLRAEQQQAEAEHTVPSASQELAHSQSEEQPMLVGLDGGWVCSREQQGGMEGKVAVLCSHTEDLPMPVRDSTFSWSNRGGPRKAPRQRHRLVTRRLAATFGPSRELGQQAHAAARELDADPVRPVVVVADGAAWIKKEQATHFPHATCILDWAHLWREVRAAILAAARAKALPEKERDYHLYFHRTCLWLGNVDQAVQGLRRLSEGVALHLLKPLQEAIRYLENQRGWIGSYEGWKAQGYPVGSGMIERAVAIVINRRMKKRGMRWCRSNATAVVALRADVLNEDWITPQPLRTFP
jgi:transposase-like protein